LKSSPFRLITHNLELHFRHRQYLSILSELDIGRIGARCVLLASRRMADELMDKSPFRGAERVNRSEMPIYRKNVSADEQRLVAQSAEPAGSPPAISIIGSNGRGV